MLWDVDHFIQIYTEPLTKALQSDQELLEIRIFFIHSQVHDRFCMFIETRGYN